MGVRKLAWRVVGQLCGKSGDSAGRWSRRKVLRLSWAPLEEGQRMWVEGWVGGRGFAGRELLDLLGRP